MFTSESVLTEIASKSYEEASSDYAHTVPYTGIDLAVLNDGVVVERYEPSSIDALYVQFTAADPQLKKSNVPFDPMLKGVGDFDYMQALDDRDKYYEGLNIGPLPEGFYEKIAEVLSEATDNFVGNLHDKPPAGSLQLLGMVAIYTYERAVNNGPTNYTAKYMMSTEKAVASDLLAPQRFVDDLIEANSDKALSEFEDYELDFTREGTLPIVLAALQPDKYSHPAMTELFKQN